MVQCETFVFVIGVHYIEYFALWSSRVEQKDLSTLSMCGLHQVAGGLSQDTGEGTLSMHF